MDDVRVVPLDEVGVFQFAGTNLSREPSRSATLFAAKGARAAGARVVLDLDFRPDQWDDPRTFGEGIRLAAIHADLVLGTADEVNAAILAEPGQVVVEHGQVSDARVAGDVEASVAQLLELGPEAVVEKRGEQGARVWPRGDEPIDVPGFDVEVQNILGAGDAFAAGFLYGYVNGWDWRRSARLGNACGAIVVTEHGCANFMPTLAEATTFAEARGGL
jgi:5-dehydro-2-deoxygluconokinase